MIRNGFTFILLAVALLVCDGSALEIEPRSSNGTLSARDEFPFFASIDIKNEDGTTAICGASLLNDQWLVTTANCLKGADEVAVHLGSEEEGRIRINVPKGNWFENPQYNEERFVNDIGLIKLPEPIQFTSDIQPIELSPVDETIRSNTEVILIGSGASKTVESTVLSVTSMAECKNTFVSLRGACSSFCAKDTTNGEKSICAGDAGGPLIRKDDRKLVGIAVFGQSDGYQSGQPQAFTNIKLYYPWIQKVTGIDLSHLASKDYTYRRVYRPWYKY